MRFSFDEGTAPKSVNLFDLTQDGVQNFEQIELKKIKKLMRLQALDAESGANLLSQHQGDYVELTLNLTAPLNHTQLVELNSHENLVDLKINVAGINNLNNLTSRKGKSASQLFCDYYQLKYNTLPSDELKELFLSLTEDE
jgi:hypothetical protein